MKYTKDGREQQWEKTFNQKVNKTATAYETLIKSR